MWWYLFPVVRRSLVRRPPVRLRPYDGVLLKLCRTNALILRNLRGANEKKRTIISISYLRAESVVRVAQISHGQTLELAYRTYVASIQIRTKRSSIAVLGSSVCQKLFDETFFSSIVARALSTSSNNNRFPPKLRSKHDTLHRGGI